MTMRGVKIAALAFRVTWNALVTWIGLLVTGFVTEIRSSEGCEGDGEGEDETLSSGKLPLLAFCFA